MKIALPHFALLILLITSCSKDQDSTVYDEASDNLPLTENAITVEQELLEIVNEHRLSLNTNTLQFSEVAYKYANKHTDYMISKGSLSHDDFSSRASHIDTEVGVEMVSENVAKDYETASEAFNGWYNSSSHKKTMEGDFTHTAISIKKDATGQYYFTQLFYKR